MTFVLPISGVKKTFSPHVQEAWQIQNRTPDLEGAVRMQQRGGPEAIQAQNQSPRQRQHHLRQAIGMVAANPVQITSQEMP